MEREKLFSCKEQILLGVYSLVVNTQVTKHLPTQKSSRRLIYRYEVSFFVAQVIKISIITLKF